LMKPLSARALGIVAVFLLALLVGCGGVGGSSNSVQPPQPSISSSSPPSGEVGEVYAFTFTASGGASPYSWSITSGGLPDGITLDGKTGVISGTPTTAQNPSFTVTVTDADSQTGNHEYSLNIVAQPAVIPVAIEIQPVAPSIGIAATTQLAATEIFSNGTTKDVTKTATWASAATGLLTVSNAGVVTGIAQGTAAVTASADSVTGFTLASVGSLPSPSPTVYVATNGNDTTGDGSSGNPYATLDRARQAVQGRPGSAVQIADGIYYLSAPVSFSSADSGTVGAPIIYEAAPGAHPVISGGARVTGWTNTSGSTWTASLSSSTFQNFEGFFYQAAGSTNTERRARPRSTAPPANFECTAAPCSAYLYNTNSNPVTASSSSTNCSVPPPSGSGFECFDQFFFNPGDLLASYHGLGLGDIEVLDFEKWTMSRMRLKSIDTATGTATLTGPTFQNANNNGFFPGHRYLLENVFESLTSPGQWYLDRCPGCASTVTVPATTWTLSYIAQTGENPNTDTVIVPQQSQLIVATGVHDVIFAGITFSHDNWMPSPTGYQDLQAAPNVTAAVSFTNSQNVIFDGCTFSHTEGWGVEFVGDDKGIVSGNQVLNSLLYDLGAGGVRIGRYTDPGLGVDTEANVAQYNLIENNQIVSGGRVQPTGIGTGVWVGNAHHNMIVHNDISDFYSGAVGVGDTYGIAKGVGLAHDNIVAFNHLYTLGQGVTSDMGGIYFATSNNSGNMDLNNVIHDVIHDYQDSDGYGGNGIYFDQGTSRAVAHNNLVYRLAWYGVFNNLSDRTSDVYPQNNVILNNIFAFTGNSVQNLGGVIQRGGDNPSSFSFVRNIVYFDLRSVQTGHWACQDVGGTNLPVPCPTRFFFDQNDYWVSSGKSLQFITTDPSTSYSLAQWQGKGEDVHSINLDPDFTSPNETSDPPANGFTLQASSPALTSPVNFVNFDPTQAGVLSPGPPAAPIVTCSNGQVTGACPAFPLQLLDPSDF